MLVPKARDGLPLRKLFEAIDLDALLIGQADLDGLDRLDAGAGLRISPGAAHLLGKQLAVGPPVEPRAEMADADVGGAEDGGAG